MKIMKNDMVRLGTVLFTITFVTAFILAYVNYMTAPVIADQTRTKINNSISSMFPDTKSIEDLAVTGLDTTVAAAYKAKDGDKTLGLAVEVKPIGFGGAIDMLVGINADGTIAKVNILSMSETAGLGTKTNTPEFLGQYEKGTAPFTVVKGSKSKDGEISAITGATISSKAVTKGINIAAEAAKSLLPKQ